MNTRTHDDYTIGWICAIPIELAASMAMLDEKHPPLPAERHDPNTYTLGRVGSHNVVMTCLPAGHFGNSHATTAAAHMRQRFKKLRFGLMVGIAGGVPSDKHDVRLGDVVISEPRMSKKSGGVMQYDFGRSEYGGEFVHTGTLNEPPKVLLTALSTLQANHVIASKEFARYLSEIPPHLKKTFAHPGVAMDRLFEADYKHPGGDTCENCDVSRLKKLRPRPSLDPVIHYGIIASGNRVIKDGAFRDEFASEYDVLCFEMEAAGLMNDFPCAVIRGICDYSDSHKNKEWQPYAAAAAAACAKELISIISPEEVVDTATIPTPLSTPLSTPSPTPVSQSSPREAMNASNVDESSSVPPSTQAFHEFFSRYHLFHSNSVALGRLVLNTNNPDDDYYPSNEKLNTEDITISHRRQLGAIISRAKGSTLYDRIVKMFSTVIRDDKLPEVQEKTYTLLNSGDVFKRLCDDNKAREWFETTIKYGWNVYIVVAIHTICGPSIGVSGLENRVSALDINPRTENVGTPSGFPDSGEQVFAVRYRKVRFNWFSSREMEHGFLKVGCNRWRVFPISGRADQPPEDDDIVEADLQDSVVKDDIEEGEVYIVGEEMIVVDES